MNNLKFQGFTISKSLISAIPRVIAMGKRINGQLHPVVAILRPSNSVPPTS